MKMGKSVHKREGRIQGKVRERVRKWRERRENIQKGRVTRPRKEK